VYRFKILLEDLDDFFLDIEISSGDTFESFHKAIIQAAGLSGQELASFYICDNKWNRKKEIALIDMSEEEEKETAPLIMKSCKLNKFIDDPHQRLIYVYDFLNLYEFYIELSKIIPAEKGVTYPRCIKKSGEIPKAGAQSIKVSAGLDDDDEELLYDVPPLKDEENEESELFSDSEFSDEFNAEGSEGSANFDDDKF